MKKRVLSMILILAMCLVMLPVTALAGDTETTGQSTTEETPTVALGEDVKVTIGGKDYELCFGLPETYYQNGSQVTKFWPNSFETGILQSDAVSKFDYYLLLFDFNENQEATEADYEAFWNQVTVNAPELRTKQENATISALQTDGYRRYVSVSVTGAFTGDVAAMYRLNGDAETQLQQTMSPVQIVQTDQLTADADGAYSFISDSAGLHYYYINLGATKSVQVSGSLGSYGNLSLMTEDGNSSYRLWLQNSTVQQPSKEVRSIDAQTLLFRVYWLDTETNLTGTIQIQEEPDHLMYRSCRWNDKDELEEEETFWDLSDLCMSPNTVTWIQLYWGTTANYTKLDADNLTSSDETVLKGTTVQQGNTTYARIDAVALGQATLSCGTYEAEITVGLPAGGGFYQDSQRTEANYLMSVTYDSDCLLTLWYMCEDGFTADEVQTLSVQVNDETVADATVTAVPRTDGKTYDIQIALPAGLTMNTDGWYNDLCVFYGGNSSRYLTIKAVEKPRLLYRYSFWNNDGKLQEDDIFRNLDDLSLTPGDSIRVQLYWGTTDEATKLETGTLTSSDTKVLQVTTYTDGDTTAEQIEVVGFGKATLTCSDGTTTYQTDLSVTLPDYGFYSAQSRDEAHYLSSPNYYELQDHVLWVMSADGFTAEELKQISVVYDEIDHQINLETTAVERGDTGRYDIWCTVPEPKVLGVMYDIKVTRTNGQREESLLRACITSDLSTQGAQVGEYTVGFSFDAGNITIITDGNESNWRIGSDITNLSGDTPYVENRSLDIVAGKKKTDETGNVYFDFSNSKQVSIEVERVWIETIDNGYATYALSADGAMELTDLDGTNVTLYINTSQKAGPVYLWATASVQVGDAAPVKVTFNILCFTSVSTTYTEVRPQDDTLEDLQAYFDTLAEELVYNGVYVVYLGEHYEGTLVISDAFRNVNLRIEGLYDSQSYTTFIGGINLNGVGAESIENICFQAPSNSESTTRALYGGMVLNVQRCTFSGYDVAVDTSENMICLSGGNVFVNNKVAARLNVGSSNGGNLNPWDRNTFIGNGTAIEMRSFNSHISPYYFRVTNTNFIGNTLDFDLQTPVTVYQYGNYYGTTIGNLDLGALSTAVTESAISKLVTYRPAKVSTVTGGKVVTNPRWVLPVQNWWRFNIPIDSIFGTSAVPLSVEADVAASDEAPYENYLTADWDAETLILNSEADDLLMSGKAFSQFGEKQIDVLDQQENTLGTWTFD